MDYNVLENEKKDFYKAIEKWVSENPKIPIPGILTSSYSFSWILTNITEEHNIPHKIRLKGEKR